MKDINLGDFLRTRRASISDDDDTAPASLRRRRGLTRAEVARRVGVSPDYYAKLEQTRRSLVPSDSVLRALADVLQLNDAAEEHMYDLARRDPGSRRPREPMVQPVGMGMLRIMSSFSGLPTLLLGRRTQILATNRAANVLFMDFNSLPASDRNAVKLVLLNDRLRRLMGDWEAVAAGLVGMLRMDLGRHPHDRRSAELVDELEAKSELFNHLWTTSHVARTIKTSKVVEHPEIGRVRLHVEPLQTVEDREQTLHVMIPESDSMSQSAARRLDELARRGR